MSNRNNFFCLFQKRSFTILLKCSNSMLNITIKFRKAVTIETAKPTESDATAKNKKLKNQNERKHYQDNDNVPSRGYCLKMEFHALVSVQCRLGYYVKVIILIFMADNLYEMCFLQVTWMRNSGFFLPLSLANTYKSQPIFMVLRKLFFVCLFAWNACMLCHLAAHIMCISNFCVWICISVAWIMAHCRHDKMSRFHLIAWE